VIVECGNCGAPLDIEEARSVVTCAYCAKKNQVAALKKLAPVTPSDFKAPEVWRPPPTAPADSTEALAYHPPSKPSWVLRIVALLVVVGIGCGIAWKVTQGATVEQVAKEPLDRTPDQIERDLHVTYRTEDSVRVTFRRGAAGPYEHVWYRWSDKDLTLPSTISLDVVAGSKIGPNVIPSLLKSLHGGFNESGAWHWGAASIRVDPTTGALSVSVDKTIGNDKPNPLRRRQLEVGWQIIRIAAFGGPEVPMSELLEVFGFGYPLKSVLALDPTMPFAKARVEVPKAFPGVLMEYDDFEISIDHPLLHSIRLSWHNAADGYLHATHFETTSAYKARRAAWMACLSKEVGAPTEQVTDFANGKKDYTFGIRGDESAAGIVASRVDLRIGDHTGPYLTTPGTGYPSAAWRRALAVMDRCR
jgi:hypothetical protein